MSVRHIYETAFDSAVKVSDADYLDDLAQSPVICGSLSNILHDAKTGSSALLSAENPSRSTVAIHCYDGHVGRERKVENFRPSGYRRHGSVSAGVVSSSLSKSLNESCGNNGRSLGTPSGTDSLPCRPHSDPLDRRRAESRSRPIVENTSKSIPVFHLPLEQSASTNNASKTFSPSTEFKKLEVGEEKEPHSNNMSLTCPTVTAPSEGFTTATPMMTYVKEHKRENAFKSGKFHSLIAGNAEDYNEPKSKDTRTSREEIKRNHSEMMSAARLKLNLDLSQPSKRPRRHFLDFWTPGHDAFHEVVDPSVELEKQDWYHGSINHKDAENALRLMKEGSFLVRCCKTSQQNYSLSIKSAGGVMHMKILQSPGGRYILKQQNQSFDSIPQMVHHFSMHPLPVYGLEHIMLKSPVISQLL